jgi:Flp pilus assembly protein TadG
MLRHRANAYRSAHRSRGAAIVYITVMMTVMMAFCSMAVDLGRVQAAKTELRLAADAAAIYAAQGLADGTAVTKAIQSAAENTVDGTPLVLQNSDVVTGHWAGGTFTAGGAPTNAVRVTATRSAARGTAVSLVFAKLLGISTCNVNATSTALYTSSSASPYVSTMGNPWLAGEPTGTIGSVTDAGYTTPNGNSEHPWQHDIAGPPGTKLASGQTYNSPVQVGISISPGAMLRLTGVSGTGTNDPLNSYAYADGTDVSSGTTQSTTYDWAATGSPASEHGMSSITAPHNAIIGVFLDANVPDSDGSIPANLDFTTQTERDYNTISPLLRQTFYVGDGKTSTGAQQTIVAPPGATRLFLGTMDGHEWANNVGGYNATVTQTNVSLVQ